MTPVFCNIRKEKVIAPGIQSQEAGSLQYCRGVCSEQLHVFGPAAAYDCLSPMRPRTFGIPKAEVSGNTVANPAGKLGSTYVSMARSNNTTTSTAPALQASMQSRQRTGWFACVLYTSVVRKADYQQCGLEAVGLTHVRGTWSATPNGELQEYSRTMRGVCLRGSFYIPCLFLGFPTAGPHLESLD